jgi:prepilin-type processing-associated H-X9-DG protein
VGTARTRLVNRLRTEGWSQRAIAVKVGVSEKAVRKLLRRLGWPKSAPAGQQLRLDEGCVGADPNLSAPASEAARSSGKDVRENARESARSADPNLSASPPSSEDQSPEEVLPTSFDSDPADRRLDRLLAHLGLLDDAAPLFRPGTRVAGAGVLLAVPALVHSGVVDVAREVYGSIGPAFYGLRTTIVALVLMALLRIKRPEGLKEHPPDDFGRVLGLDRAPEVKTVRRKLARLAALGRAAEFGRALARRRAAAHGGALGFLYVDGHVRAYHGRHSLPKAHVARMRIAMPATTDYWVGDAAGEPLLLITAEANAGLVEMLPIILDEVRPLVGKRRVTVVFDRGGWSPSLFEQILDRDFDILTYRKAPKRRVPRRAFQTYTEPVEGRPQSYVLADQNIRLRLPKRRRLALRQVTRLADDGRHQTAIVTSRRDLPAFEIAQRMFDRWRQENFFKYLREEYALDALVEHEVVADDPEREVPNPARKALEIELRATRAALAELQAQYGVAALENPEQRRPTMRGFKIAHGKIGRALRDLLERITELEVRRARMPARVPVQAVVPTQVVKLAPERQHLASLLKMVAYQAESDLLRLLTPHYRRAEDEGRTLVQNALASSADLLVTDTTLHVCLTPLSSAHRSAAVAALCEDLNALSVRFPGTKLVLRFSIADTQPTAQSGQN